MKKILLVWSCCVLALCPPAQSQEKIKHINWSIMVNEKLQNTEIVNAVFELKMLDSTRQIVNVWAYAGNIEMHQSDFDKIQSEKVTKIWFRFTIGGVYTQRSTYELRVYKDWIRAYFMVLKAYDLRISKYREMFVPRKDGKQYVFDVFLPARAIQRLRKE